MRSDAQRREYRNLQGGLRAAEGLAAERERSLKEVSEWAALLEQEEAPLRAERAQLRQDLEVARLAANAHQTALDALQATSSQQAQEAAAKLAVAQATTEQATQEFHRTEERLAEVERTLQDERADRKRDVDGLSKRCADTQHEVERLTKRVGDQAKEIRDLRADDERIAQDRMNFRRANTTIKDLKRELAAANEHLEALSSRAAKLQGDAEYWQWIAEHPPTEPRPKAATRSPDTASAREVTSLRQTVTELKSNLAAAQKQNAEADGQLAELRATLAATEEKHEASQTHAERLRGELEKAQAQIREWRHGEIAQIGVAAANEGAKVATVYFATKANPEAARAVLSAASDPGAIAAPEAPIASRPALPAPPAPATVPSPAPVPQGLRAGSVAASPPAVASPAPVSPAAKPQETDEDRRWREFSQAAQRRGWEPRDDNLVARKRREQELADRLAQQQAARRVAVTEKRLPPHADRDFLAIRAAIEARIAYHRRHKATWELEFCKLDHASEGFLTFSVDQEIYRLEKALLMLS